MERQLHKIDATGKVIGRMASDIAIILRGKNKPEYQPHIDAGDIVEVSNINLVKVTEKKLEQKKYFSYSGYQSGLKTKQMKNIPLSEALRLAVRDMLPATRLRNGMLKRLIIR